MTLVRGLPLPGLLLELLNGGRWKHPGDAALRALMPWFESPVDFLIDVDQIRRESRSLDSLTANASTAEIFRQASGRRAPSPVELPWLDIDLAVLIAVNRIPGDDVALALDYRGDPTDPRLVASDFWAEPHRCSWRVIAPAFTAFAKALKFTEPRHYHYVGPADIRDRVASDGHGRSITSHDELIAWMAEQPADERDEPFTFVIDTTGTLRLAPQRSEHVACAGGEPVLSAGEITFAGDREHWLVHEVSNQSTGYCPDPTSWTAVQAALARAGLDHPGAFTHPIVFRRCSQCRQRNIVKDDHFVCAVCQSPLPSTWNVDQPD